MYISITECDLTEAQKFIKALTTDLELELEKFAKSHTKGVGFDLRIVIHQCEFGRANGDDSLPLSRIFITQPLPRSSVQSHSARPFCVTAEFKRITFCLNRVT